MSYAQKCIKYLTKHAGTIASVETLSCTGGAFLNITTDCGTVTEHVFKEGVVIPSAPSALHRFGVREDILKAHGNNTARAAEMLARALNARCRVSVAVSIVGTLPADNKQKGKKEANVYCCFLLNGRKAHVFTISTAKVAGVKRREQKAFIIGQTYKNLYGLFEKGELYTKR